MKLRLLFLLNFFFLAAQAQNNIPAGIYDFKVPAHNGGTIDLAQFKGKKILIVNVTGQDEENRQYAQLEALSQKYKDRLVVIGFLTEDFCTPPGSKKNMPITNKVYNVSFPLAEKVLVRGENMAPIYKWLTMQKYNKLKDTEVKWDFQKYLINEKGDLVAVFDPKIKAGSPEIMSAVEQQ